MLKLEKIYTVKSNATADIRKAISRNQCAAGEYEARKVDGGFQIFAIDPQPEQEVCNELDTQNEIAQEETAPVVLQDETQEKNIKQSDKPSEYQPVAQPEPQASDESAPEPQKAETSVELPERQYAVLNALIGAKALEGKEESGIVGKWIPFKELHESNNPHNLPVPAIPGIAQALIKKNLIITDMGKDRNGKRAVIVTITEAGIAALQKAS